MGVGMCCCGDDTPGLGTLTSTSIVYPPQDCARCKSPCHSPNKLIPGLLSLSVTLIDGGDYYLDPPTLAKATCDCAVEINVVALALQGLSGKQLLPTSQNSCIWATDCTLAQSTASRLTSTSCPAPIAFQKTRECFAPANGVNAGCWLTNWYGRLTVSSASCPMPLFQILTAGCNLSTPPYDPNPCPSLASRASGVGRSPVYRYNEVFSCDPFYYEADLWYLSISPQCCILKAVADCCYNDEGRSLYVGAKVIVS